MLGHDKPRAGPSRSAKQLQETGKNFTILAGGGTSPVILSNSLAGGGISAADIRRCFFSPARDDCPWPGVRSRSIPWPDIPTAACGSPSRDHAHPALPWPQPWDGICGPSGMGQRGGWPLGVDVTELVDDTPARPNATLSTSYFITIMAC
jgi:hypothetical protein